jgi:hypothetical protein
MLHSIIGDVFGMDDFYGRGLSFVLYVPGFSTILEGIQSLLVKFSLWRDTGYHYCLGIASQ